MPRIALIGNAGGGKSTLARLLAERLALPHVELDRLLWQDDWQPTPTESYDRQHAQAIAGADWVIDGLGRQASIPARLARATQIILVDMPIWMHFWLAAERQIAWATGQLAHPSGAIATMPPTQALCRSIWTVEQGWMPAIRAQCDAAAARGTPVIRLASVEEIDAHAARIRYAAAPPA